MTKRINVIPLSFQLVILKRFMTDSQIDNLHQGYQEAYRRGRSITPPNDKTLRLAALAKKIGVSEAAKQTGETVNRVSSAIRRVGSYNYMTS